MKNIWIAGNEEFCGNYMNLVTQCGMNACASPVLCHNTFDGLILPGGGDIEPSLFGEENRGSEYIDYALDTAQLNALSMALKLKKPILGICKGIQIINVFFQGGIIQDLPTAALHKYIGKDQTHITYNKKNSYLYKLFGSTMVTNSAHHQGIGKIGEHLHVIQYAQDGIVEGIVHDTLPVYGVQWHPERMDFEIGRKLMEYIYLQKQI